MHQLIDLLKQASAILEPFTRNVRAGTRVYDGTRYAPASPQSPEPYALAWWSSFQTTIALLDGLETLKPSQLDYLRHSLCGGMGSFGDFSLDEARLGASATKANRELNRIRASLYDTLKRFDAKVA
jgi:hypothetical protein